MQLHEIIMKSQPLLIVWFPMFGLAGIWWNHAMESFIVQVESM